MNKCCTQCKNFKELDDFHYQKHGKHNRTAVCKSCYSVIRRQRHLANKERDNRLSRQYREKHREYLAKCEQRWQKDNAENVRANTRNYRSRKLNNEGQHSAEDFAELVKHYGPLCLRCGEERKLTADHVMPLSRGGSNSIDNIQPLCGRCNSSKNNLHDTDYRPDGGEFAHQLSKEQARWD